MGIELIILIISALITSAISAVIGMGGGIILLGIMALIIPEGYLVIALHGIIQLVSNSTRTFVFKEHLKKNLIFEFFIGAVTGLFISALVIYLLMHFLNVQSASEIKIDFLKSLIGIFILWYLYLKPKDKKGKKLSFIGVGGISGISSIFVGATGPLIAPFFLNGHLKKENIIANKAACQVISHFGKIPIFIFLFGVNYFKEYEILVPLIIAVYIGTYLGKKILSFLSEKVFKIVFRICLTAIAIKLVVNEILLLF